MKNMKQIQDAEAIAELVAPVAIEKIKKFEQTFISYHSWPYHSLLLPFIVLKDVTKPSTPSYYNEKLLPLFEKLAPDNQDNQTTIRQLKQQLFFPSGGNKISEEFVNLVMNNQMPLTELMMVIHPLEQLLSTKIQHHRNKGNESISNVIAQIKELNNTAEHLTASGNVVAASVLRKFCNEKSPSFLFNINQKDLEENSYSHLAKLYDKIEHIAQEESSQESVQIPGAKDQNYKLKQALQLKEELHSLSKHHTYAAQALNSYTEVLTLYEKIQQNPTMGTVAKLQHNVILQQSLFHAQRVRTKVEKDSQSYINTPLNSYKIIQEKVQKEAAEDLPQKQDVQEQYAAELAAEKELSTKQKAGAVEDQSLMGAGAVENQNLMGAGAVEDQSLMGAGAVENQNLMGAGAVEDQSLMGALEKLMLTTIIL